MKEFFEDVTVVTLALGAIGSLAVGIWKYAIRPVRSGCKLLRTFVDESRTIHGIVRRELTANGGSSIRDVVHRIDLKINAVDARSRASFQQMKLMIWETDPSGRWISVSRRMSQALERTTDELLGSNWLNCVHPDDRQNVWDEWISAVNNRRDLIVNLRICDRDGTVRDFRMEACPMTTPDGAILGYLGIMEEASEVAA